MNDGNHGMVFYIQIIKEIPLSLGKGMHPAIAVSKSFEFKKPLGRSIQLLDCGNMALSTLKNGDNLLGFENGVGKKLQSVQDHSLVYLVCIRFQLEPWKGSLSKTLGRG